MPMKTHLTNSQLAPVLTTTESVSLCTTESQKAWHLLAILLSIGRPARSIELASRCTFFDASPELIEFLCSASNSPILLTNNLFVTLSLVGLSAFGEYVSNLNLIDAFVPRISFFGACGLKWDDCLRMRFRKRKQVVFDTGDGYEKDQGLVPLPKRIRNNCTKVHDCIIDDISRSINIQPIDMSAIVNEVMLRPPLFVKSSAEHLHCKMKEIERVEGEMDEEIFMQRKVPENLMAGEPDAESAVLTTILDGELDLRSKVNINATYCPDNVKQSNTFPVEAGCINDASKGEDKQLIDLGSPKGGVKNVSVPFNIGLLDMPSGSEFERINKLNFNNKIQYLGKESTATHVDTSAIFPEYEYSIAEKQLSKLSAESKITHRDAIALKVQALRKSIRHGKAVNTPNEKLQLKSDQTSISIVQKSQQNHNDMHIKERKGNSTSISSKDQLKPKILPNFESYIVEEEEGSGGYGIVYRARRKNDGTVVAIKYPHANARRHHVINELRMLQRFGGKNFVIKYEGSFKSGNSDCFVLEHVDHDRPEVLKKEIDIFQLQWYGYCMFRALASLHKQGIVHRDVKPGNFLFSCKANKGYLIDFNLAMDLRQKYGITNKSKVGYDVSFNHITLPDANSVPPSNGRKFPSAKSLGAINQEATKSSKSLLEIRSLKEKAAGQMKAHNDLGVQNKINSQGADGSGITSAKDVTSMRTPSAEKLREPLPCQGRKELISLLQEAMQRPNHEALHVPAPMRKRVAASPGKVDRELVYLTPMPLRSTGISVAGAGLINSKGDKHKREGPCAGTKGFRAPEVLFRSQHQGPKIDIWSAGVTLLYLMIGRAPFFGEPEQNIKDIAKLRGSEVLWEVAKLHNRESSFPQDLYDTQSLPSISLWDWCQTNTKRREFLEVIPRSLFDLVDKCLAVNPRMRISAEDALKHEFFAPCHEGLRKQRLLRQGLSLDSGTSHPSHGQSIARLVKISPEQA